MKGEKKKKGVNTHDSATATRDRSGASRAGRLQDSSGEHSTLPARDAHDRPHGGSWAIGHVNRHSDYAGRESP